MTESNAIIRIQMLGGFQLSVGDKYINDSMGHTRQLWNLLEYLIANRHKSVSASELISVLWPDNRSSNPANALKNLVYRIRASFSSNGIPNAKEMISYHHGSYHWNNSLPCIVDTEEFEKILNIASHCSSPEEKAHTYLEALKIYKGDFLPSSCYEEWVVPLAKHYRSLYFQCVYEAALLLLDANRYEDVYKICQAAVAVDPFEERAQQYLIYALVQQNKQSAALEHYNFVTNLYYRELGIRPSEALRRLYREITKAVNNIEMDLSIIKEDLSEQNQPNSAFYCDYEIFKNLYRLEARAISRSGQSIYISLITVTDLENNVPDPQTLNSVMDRLLSIIRSNLRRGDVISRFSATQYVMMMPALTYKNGEMVLKRIIKKFKLSSYAKNIKLHTALQPLDPAF